MVFNFFVIGSVKFFCSSLMVLFIFFRIGFVFFLFVFKYLYCCMYCFKVLRVCGVLCVLVFVKGCWLVLLNWGGGFVKWLLSDDLCL